MADIRPKRRSKKYGPITIHYVGMYDVTSVSMSFLFWRIILWKKGK